MSEIENREDRPARSIPYEIALAVARTHPCASDGEPNVWGRVVIASPPEEAPDPETFNFRRRQ